MLTICVTELLPAARAQREGRATVIGLVVGAAVMALSLYLLN
jgi:zinc transporter ZupT